MAFSMQSKSQLHASSPLAASLIQAAPTFPQSPCQEENCYVHWLLFCRRGPLMHAAQSVYVDVQSINDWWSVMNAVSVATSSWKSSNAFSYLFMENVLISYYAMARCEDQSSPKSHCCHHIAAGMHGDGDSLVDSNYFLINCTLM